MLYVLQQRKTLTGAITYRTPYVDVLGEPELVYELVVYTLRGPMHSLTVQLETCNDPEVWSDVPGASITFLPASGVKFGAVQVFQQGREGRPEGEIFRLEVSRRVDFGIIAVYRFESLFVQKIGDNDEFARVRAQSGLFESL